MISSKGTLQNCSNFGSSVKISPTSGVIGFPLMCIVMCIVTSTKIVKLAPPQGHKEQGSLSTKNGPILDIDKNLKVYSTMCYIFKIDIY
jgi:hypothetical protein